MYRSGFLLFFIGILINKQFQANNGVFPEAASFRHDYKYENTTKTYYKAHPVDTWMSAVQICAAEGAFLASPRSFFEATVMENIFRNYTLDVSDYWIGSSSIYSKDADGPFLTVEGKSMMNTGLNSWEKGYPINVNVSRCVVLNIATSKMKNIQYNKTYPFLCLKRNYAEPENILNNYNISSAYAGYTTTSDSLQSLIKVFREKADFLTAMQICARNGGKLGAPLNENELKVYKSLIKDEDEYYWLGLTDGFGTRYFNYIDGDVTPKPFLNWADGKPDNEQTKNWFVRMNREGRYEDCIGSVQEKSMFFCSKHRQMTFYNNPKNFKTFIKKKDQRLSKYIN